MSDTQDELIGAVTAFINEPCGNWDKATAIIELCRAHFQRQAEPVTPDWYQCPTTDGWFEHPADANLLEFHDDLKVGDTYELDVCWNGKQKFVVKSVHENGIVEEVELIESSRNLYTSPPIPADPQRSNP